MGKGNRYRADRAEEIIANASPALTQKQKKTNTITWVVSILVVLLIAGFILASLCVSNGWLERRKIAVSSENYKITGTMMGYFVNSYYQNTLYEYASYYGIDTSVALNAQNVTGLENVTWYDYIAASLEGQLQQELAFCEGAKAEGIKLEQEEKDLIASNLESLEKAASQKLLSVNAYCTQAFGAGVLEKDVEDALEIELLAQKYYQVLYDRNEEDLKKDGSDDELKKYVDEHPEDFQSACTLQLPLKATLTTADAEATDLEKATYETDKAAMLDAANAIMSAAVDEASFKAAVIDYLCGSNGEKTFDSAYATAFASVAEENLPSSAILAEVKTQILDYCKKTMQGETVTKPEFAEDKNASKYQTVRDNVYDALVTNGYNAMEKDVTYVNPTDSSATALNQWLFASDRKANDAKVISDEGDTTSTYTVVFVKEAAELDSTPVRDVAHILVTASTGGTVKSSAIEILDAYKAGEQTLDAFKALGEKYTEDSNVVYENVQQGEMVASFNDWLFDDARKEGDTDIVTTDYGDHVMYFIGKGEEAWKYNARKTMVSERLLDWCNEATEKYKIKSNEKFFVDLG